MKKSFIMIGAFLLLACCSMLGNQAKEAARKEACGAAYNQCVKDATNKAGTAACVVARKVCLERPLD